MPKRAELRNRKSCSLRFDAKFQRYRRVERLERNEVMERLERAAVLSERSD